MTYLLIGVSNFIYIASRAFQQLNVTHHKVSWLYATGAVMAVCEATLFGSFVYQGAISFSDGITLEGLISFGGISIPLWLGGSVGSHTAMCTHKRLREN